MKNPTVCCGICKGKGFVPLTGVYLETLKGVLRFCGTGAYVVANQHAYWFRCKPTALNNRLSYLETHGFLRSEK